MQGILLLLVPHIQQTVHPVRPLQKGQAFVPICKEPFSWSHPDSSGIPICRYVCPQNPPRPVKLFMGSVIVAFSFDKQRRQRHHRNQIRHQYLRQVLLLRTVPAKKHQFEPVFPNNNIKIDLDRIRNPFPWVAWGENARTNDACWSPQVRLGTAFQCHRKSHPERNGTGREKGQKVKTRKIAFHSLYPSVEEGPMVCAAQQQTEPK